MAPYVARWGIIGCGWISSEFVKDISQIRDDVNDVSHAVVAVGSRDKTKAQKFIDDWCPLGATGQQRGQTELKAEAYGSYDEVYNHPDVEIIYIGTPNTSHYLDAKAALDANKHCLLEKPATLNAAEWKDLVKIAKAKSLFLMEAMWTRFLPIAYTLQDKLHKEKVIGDIKSVDVDFSCAFFKIFPETHRTLNLAYAGGPAYDLGPYIINPAMLALYHHPDNDMTPPETVQGTMLKAHTGVDLTTTITMTFPKLGAMAVGTTSFAYNNSPERTGTITGTKGEIILNDGLSRLTKFTIRRAETDDKSLQPKSWHPDEVIEQGFHGFGLMYEADAVARSLRDGELENKRMPHNESTMILEILDKVRKDGGYVLPEGMEKVV